MRLIVRAQGSVEGGSDLKRRICMIVLCALLLTALLPGVAVKADDRLTFVAVNDYLPPELINTIVYYGGVGYVPCWLFTNYGLGLSYSYFSTNSTAYLYNTSRQLFFELSTGRTYDSADNEYSAPAILWGGTVYFPLDFVANYYGTFTYTVIGSNDYGSIVRIKTGKEALTDDIFFRAAYTAMQRYYQAYQEAIAPAPTPVETPKPTEKPSREGDVIRLGLDGLPSAETMDLLKEEGIRACFFLSGEEIRSDPDMVRRIACEGHTLGVSSPSGRASDCERAAGLLWETARVRTILAAMPDDAVMPEGMVNFPRVRTAPGEVTDPEETAYSVTSKLEMRAGDQTLIFPAESGDPAALRLLLYYLHDMEFSVATFRETDGGGTPITP